MSSSPVPQLLLGDLPAGAALIGVSGGRDSVALLLALAEARFPLTVCHLDHALREVSAADAVFVKSLAERYGLPYVGERRLVHEIAAEEKVSVETAARLARHRFFAECAKTHGCRDVILAHHADDQVETFLVNLLRGAGSTGLRGMLPVSEHTIDGMELRFFRPILGRWRTEIDAYVQHHGLEYREDESNACATYTRNRIRHEIIPMLSQAYGRNVTRAIWKAAEISRADQEWLAELTAPLLQQTSVLDVKTLRSLPTAAQRRVIHHWLRANEVPDVSFDDVEAVRGLLCFEGAAKVNLAHAMHARRRAGVIFLER